MGKSKRSVKTSGKESSDDEAIKFVCGICALTKKAQSRPMQEIMRRFLKIQNVIDVVYFGDETILNKPVEEWPHCDVLVSFFSTGFPMHKAKAYAELRKPYLVNDLDAQDWLFNRLTVYRVLQNNGVPVPRYVYVDRDGDNAPAVHEFDEHIEVDGVKLPKPVVEKPVSGEDHNIYIYYPRSAGGGCKRLFRKVADRSSEYYPDVNELRRSGSYIYEEFLPSAGTDIKVYTVGPDYAHAEARKSPVVDGRVQRTSDGKEVRYPVLLTDEEKRMARVVCLAFKQNVCGFDLIRSDGKSYVCDVNGWSFVKNSVKYYDDCARLLYNLMLLNIAPKRFRRQRPILPPQAQVRQTIKQSDNIISEDHGGEELRCVVAVLRHGDRTPKQKMKMVVTDHFLRFFDGENPRKEMKIKSAKGLTRILAVTREVLALYQHARNCVSDDDEHLENDDTMYKLQQMRRVLERGNFTGINRKVQLKPMRWRTVKPRTGDAEKQPSGPLQEKVMEALLILKWGGELTHAGRIQAETLGSRFRQCMYPGESLGFLRLHSTYRHNLKIYASDEGRVQVTAAAFAKGFLDLEGKLTPILFSLVRKDEEATRLLDDSSAAATDLDIVKKEVHQTMSRNEPIDIAKMVPTHAHALEEAVREVGNPMQSLHELHGLVKALTLKLSHKVEEVVSCAPTEVTAEPSETVAGIIIGGRQASTSDLCEGEGVMLVYARWKKLLKDLYNRKTGKFNISNIPDIYDCIKYDMVHNLPLLDSDIGFNLLRVARMCAAIIVPQEYGIDAEEKLKIGSRICHSLLAKIRDDMRTARNVAKDKEADTRLAEEYVSGINTPSRHVRTRLYFTSESHIHSLLNVIRYYPQVTKTNALYDQVSASFLDNMPELDYLTHIVFRLYENMNVPEHLPDRFRLELCVSPGALLDEPVKSAAHPFQSPAVSFSASPLIVSRGELMRTSSVQDYSTSGRRPPARCGSTDHGFLAGYDYAYSGDSTFSSGATSPVTPGSPLTPGTPKNGAAEAHDKEKTSMSVRVAMVLSDRQRQHVHEPEKDRALKGEGTGAFSVEASGRGSPELSAVPSQINMSPSVMNSPLDAETQFDSPKTPSLVLDSGKAGINPHVTDRRPPTSSSSAPPSFNTPGMPPAFRDSTPASPVSSRASMSPYVASAGMGHVVAVQPLMLLANDISVDHLDTLLNGAITYAKLDTIKK
eukprot:Rmarinus@m.23464